jgi:EmrB/QacA subfamily drug resistance transporter
MDFQPSEVTTSQQKDHPLNENTKTHRGWVTGALLLAVFMIAIEGTIIATAMPRIVADLGGFALYSWVFSLYLLTQVVTIPIYGKLADLYGRKPIFLLGILIFILSSALCGQAHTMVALMAFRTLQGIGAGAVQPIAVTLAGDLYKPEERHRVQGWIGSVWGISAIVGPSLGGFIVEYLHWSWVFYINVPLGALTMAGIIMYLHESPAHKKHKIDYAGTLLLTISAAAFMLAVLQGGTAWAWSSQQSLSLFAFSFVSMVALIFCESRAAEPILPLWVFKNSLIRLGGLIAFFNGALFLGYSAMISTHVQGVLRDSAIAAGMALGAMAIGWPIASFLSGRVMKALGYKNTCILGGFLTIIGAVAIALGLDLGATFIALTMFVLGMGLGFYSNALIITIQSSVVWNQRGVATANNMFMRTLGCTIGVAALGSVLNASLLKNLSGTALATHDRPIDLVNQLLNPKGGTLTAADQSLVMAALDGAMKNAFWSLTFIAVLGLLFSLWLPHPRTLKSEV